MVIELGIRVPRMVEAVLCAYYNEQILKCDSVLRDILKSDLRDIHSALGVE